MMIIDFSIFYCSFSLFYVIMIALKKFIKVRIQKFSDSVLLDEVISFPTPEIPFMGRSHPYDMSDYSPLFLLCS